MDEARALAGFAVLSEPTRLRILKALVVAGPDGMRAGDIGIAVGASPSRASFHLSSMTDSGLIRARRQARHVIYDVDFAHIGALLSFVLHDCCRGNAVVGSCCAPKATD